MGVGWQDLKYIWFALIFMSVTSGQPFLVCFVLLPSFPPLLFMAHRWVFTRWQFSISTLTVKETMWCTYALYFTPLLFIAATTDWSNIEI